LAFALTVCGVAATAASAAPATQAYTLESTEISVLAPDSPEYQPWATWIAHENARKPALRRGDGESAVDGVGQITLKLRSSQDSKAQAASARLDADSAEPLPQTGIAGQQITVINQTRSVYQEWVYKWTHFSGGDSGWSEVHRVATYCGDGIKGRASLCAASGF
jgi:hypothetical protein